MVAAVFTGSALVLLTACTTVTHAPTPVAGAEWEHSEGEVEDVKCTSTEADDIHVEGDRLFPPGQHGDRGEATRASPR